MKRVIIYLVVWLSFIAIVISGRYVILGRAKIVSLKTDAISSAIEQSFKSSGQGSYAPIEGKDYRIAGVRYFDNNQWVVVAIAPLGTSADSAKTVLQQVGSGYKKVLGPTNFFQDSDLAPLPGDVSIFLKENK